MRSDSRPKLSVVVAVLNEEPMLRHCLESLGFADELVVVIDDQTTDRSAAIARRFTKHLFWRRFDSFDKQKNFAISKTTGQWILIIDADERMTPAGAKEIRGKVENSDGTNAYRASFRNFFLGREMKHGGWTKEANIRLVKRRYAKYTGEVHEQFPVPGEVGRLEEKIWHLSHRDMASQVRKTLEYSQLAAEAKAAKHPKVTYKGLVGILVREFFRRFVRQGGWRDGLVGLVEAVHQTYTEFCILVMIWEEQRSGQIDRAYAQIEKKAKK